MRMTWLVRRAGLDGNPLRRRTDKIAEWATVGPRWTRRFRSRG